MATRQVKTVTKTAPAARSKPIRKTAGKPEAAPAVLKLVTTKAANKERTATSAPKPASMTGPLPPIVTLKHLAEWAGYTDVGHEASEHLKSLLLGYVVMVAC